MMGSLGTVLRSAVRRQFVVAGLRAYHGGHVGTTVLREYLVEAPARPLSASFSRISRTWTPFSYSMSTAAAEQVQDPPPPVPQDQKDKRETVEMEHSQYWGIVAKQQMRDDGTPWPWNSFRPIDAYVPDITIDLKKHHKPESWTDTVAFWVVKSLRLPTDLFFRERCSTNMKFSAAPAWSAGMRAMMLETVAAVPGMVGGMLLHFKSLRRFEHSGGWIKALLEEAENERMHLMTFMEVAQPKWYERALVVAVQGVFFNAYFVLYLISPRLAHRITGYLEEEAIYSYTQFLTEIEKGNIPNGPAPAIAIDYWRLPKDANIYDVVMVVRADEAHHRDVNHFAADIHKQGKELREAAAPIGYH